MGFFRRLFGGGSEPAGGPSGVSEPLLGQEELERIGTDDDLLKNYDRQAERNFQAMQAEQSGDPGTAEALYKENVAEEFVGASPYERLAGIYGRQGRSEEALHVTEAFIRLAKSGRLPRGSQRSADGKLAEFEARAARLRDQSR
ncbi:hypothetical protein [Rubrobacter indicoceani]|uniref:hypothetical protein n=1 Tax=Rubrobacter indicoceani TaxID=2051957 RepID=UPI000E5C214D|nr:hypothetical protein [Rubrobacter indicoceani]